MRSGNTVTQKKVGLCESLPWDSAFFGKRIGRVTTNQLSVEQVTEILQWCRENEIDCLYFLANSDDPPTHLAVAQQGFRFVDVRMTFSREVGSPPAQAGLPVRVGTKLDRPYLIGLTKGLFERTRFFADPEFDRERCTALYQEWVGKSCLDPHQRVFLAEQGGYVTCGLDPIQKRGSIGLIGVSPTARGKGVADALIGRALEWFHEMGALKAEVVTQGRNVEAQRLYQRHHFRTQSVMYWYHWWRKSRL